MKGETVSKQDAERFYATWGFWPISGGDDGDEDPPADDDDNDDDDNDDANDQDPDLKDLDERARAIVLAEREKRRTAEKNANTAAANARKLEKRTKDLERANASDEERKLAEAKEEGAKEEREKFFGQLKKASVRAEAAGKMNPDLAVKLVDLDDIDVDDNGDIKESDVKKAVADLLENNPELAVSKKPKKSGGDTGNGKGGDGGDGVDMNDALRAIAKGRR